jgi:hypothetical protein
MLSGGAETDPEQTVRFAAFQQALRTAGWVEGRNISIDNRYADGQTARIDSFAREIGPVRRARSKVSACAKSAYSCPPPRTCGI